jgi:hypothetical protein
MKIYVIAVIALVLCIFAYAYAQDGSKVLDDTKRMKASLEMQMLIIDEALRQGYKLPESEQSFEKSAQDLETSWKILDEGIKNYNKNYEENRWLNIVTFYRILW